MNPRLTTARIITDAINLDLKQFKKNKLGIFLDHSLFLLKIEIMTSENSTLILKDKGHFYIFLWENKQKSEF